MRGVLVDAGPLIAWVDRRDHWHDACVVAAERVHVPLVTVWPAVTEAVHLVGHVAGGANAVLGLLESGAVGLAPLASSDLPRIRELLDQYGDRDMDLADAALVRVGERDGLDTILTVDRADFRVYRLHGRRRFKILP